MKVVLLHAYARSNAGDGLLVDETLNLVQDCFGGATVDLVAMAPETFPEFALALNPVSGPSSSMKALDILRVLLTGRPHPSVARLIEEADLAIAVGGGYLRASSPKGLAKTYISQICQLPSRRSTTPRVYLPQSIGPFPVPSGLIGLRRLGKASAVFVRDDRSLTDLDEIGVEAERLPDLAVLAVGRDVITHHASIGGRVGVVARSLGSRSPAYDSNIRALVKQTDGALLVQSEGRGNDDPHYYAQAGFTGPWPSLTSALETPDLRPGVVVSVRLHGAIQAILAGVPSIHLSYERKGWGAYDDLGISRFVHHAKMFDRAEVLAQISELRSDPSGYWEAIQQSIPSLKLAREKLAARVVGSVLTSTAAGSRPASTEHKGDR